jgi:DNA invertase Pin-like site-specific DNA recombinase
MVRCAIYARFSTDKQNERSVDDQVHLCAERAEREGWTVDQVFPDFAISGATRDRPGLNALIGALDRFDVILTESIDRLSRDQEDIAHIFKLVRHAGARLVTLSDGEVSEIHVGLKGTMAALFLKDLGDKVRRGQIGNAKAGRIPGGRSYGYRPVVKLDARGRPEAGWSEIEEDEAEVIRRIFTEFLAGSSPLSIAKRLNEQGIRSPRGGKWNASTILGNKKRANGVLHNPLYAGRIVYNRQRFEKHPITRRRLSKANPPELWITTQVDDLRIVDEETFQAVATRFGESAVVPPSWQRRPKRLLSELVECGICGGNVTIHAKDYWYCSTRKNTGMCSNAASIRTAELERRVLDALKHKLLTPEWVEEFVDEWRILTNEENRRRQAHRARAEARMVKAQGRVDRLTNAIADGLGEYQELKTKLMDAYAERRNIQAEIDEGEAINLLAFHPGIALEYRRWIENAQANLDSGEYDTDEFRASLRPHIGKVVMSPNPEGRGAILELHGVLAAMLQSVGGASASSDRTVKLVAGVGFMRCSTMLRAMAA